MIFKNVYIKLIFKTFYIQFIKTTFGFNVLFHYLVCIILSLRQLTELEGEIRLLKELLCDRLLLLTTCCLKVESTFLLNDFFLITPPPSCKIRSNTNF